MALTRRVLEGLRKGAALSFLHGAPKHAPAGTPAAFVLRVPSTNDEVETYPMATDACVDEAVQSNRIAFQQYATTCGSERASLLRRLATLIHEHAEPLATLETLNTGRPIAEVRDDVAGAADCFEFFAGVASTTFGQQVELPGGSFGYTRREPLGACAGIGAWNYPLLGLAWKLAPALACGNTFTFKPAELTPLTALRLAELAIDAGFPKGTFNVVLGDSRVGKALTEHPDVAKVSFTGSLSTGTEVYTAAARRMKHATMELGGKSPLIVCQDADVDEAVSGAMMANFYATGQVCSNGTRVYVHEQQWDEFVDKLVSRTEKLRLGDPFNEQTDIGPLVSQEHRERVLAYVRRGLEEGATRLLGGNAVDNAEVLGSPELVKGAYMTPCIFTDCSDDMTICREEIFGPVLCLLRFSDEDEVVARANNTHYGLAAGVFTQNLARAHRLAAKLEAGTVWINDYNLSPSELPWGGNKSSGVGRENGLAAVEHWSQPKSVFVQLGSVACSYPR